MRSILVLLHRYIGLATAVFLFLAGITGSILAFHHELDEWLNPEFYHTTSEGPVLAPGTLVERVEQANPRMQVWYMEFPSEPGHAALMALVPRNDPATGKPYDERPVVHYLDAVSGEPVGTRYWGECCFSRKNFVPFILEFHYNLSLPGNWGLWLMGIVAIAWVIDCFVSLVLTFPRGRPFLSKWWTAWKIKRQRMNHDVHRAGGLWLWLLLTPVAVSSVAMNLPEQVFKPVVSLFSPVEPSVYEARGRMPTEQLGTTAYDFHQAYITSSPRNSRTRPTASPMMVERRWPTCISLARFGDDRSTTTRWVALALRTASCASDRAVSRRPARASLFWKKFRKPGPAISTLLTWASCGSAAISFSARSRGFRPAGLASIRAILLAKSP